MAKLSLSITVATPYINVATPVLLRATPSLRGPYHRAVNTISYHSKSLQSARISSNQGALISHS